MMRPASRGAAATPRATVRRGPRTRVAGERDFIEDGGPLEERKRLGHGRPEVGGGVRHGHALADVGEAERALGDAGDGRLALELLLAADDLLVDVAEDVVVFNVDVKRVLACVVASRGGVARRRGGGDVNSATRVTAAPRR